MVEVITVNRITGRSSGTVTCRRSATLFAPSTFAAS